MIKPKKHVLLFIEEHNFPSVFGVGYLRDEESLHI